jgi:N-acetylmuramoyl-L-alanine amidase
MQAMSIIIIKSILTAALMLAYYFLALRNRRLHSYNRFYLLATVAASLVVPFLHFDWYSIKEVTSESAIKVIQVMSTGMDEEMTLQQMESAYATSTLLTIGYSLVSLALLAITVSKIVWIFRLKRTNKVETMKDYNLVHTNSSRAPFSFMNNLFWKEGTDADSETGRRILQHELTHIRQRHTMDKMFMQLVLVTCWINPFYWLIQKELALVHEFLADEKAIEDNDTASFAMMLLESHYKSALPVIVNPFYSSTKRRIMMLQQTSKTRFAKLRRAMVLPLLAIPVLLFSFTTNKREISTSKSKTNITLILDAAHGGIDMGAKGPNGINEKDMNLMICDRIEQLAPDYNVRIVRTRTSDEQLDLYQRAAIANREEQGVFVSIHVNKNVREQTDQNGVKMLSNKAVNGIEVIVTGKNKKYGACKILASAVVGTLGSTGARLTLTEKGILVLRESNHPAIAIECGNMDNDTDMNRLRDKDQLDAMCRGILSGIVAYGNAGENTGK